jgi:hypothetical protein
LLESVAIGARKGHAMREKLNENPKAQVALVAILVVVGAFMFLKSSSGGEEEGVEAAPTEATVAGTGAVGTATGATPGEAVESAVQSLETGATASVAATPVSVPTPPPPRRLLAAYDANRIVVLLIVRKGGIDSAFTARASALLKAAPKVALFVVSAKHIARYAALTIGLEVNRVPALVVLKPKHLSRGTPQATVSYGFQTPESVLQAVVNANYHGRERTYHPE